MLLLLNFSYIRTIEQLHEMSFVFKAVVLLDGKTMECLYDNGSKFASFLLTGPVLVIALLQY